MSREIKFRAFNVATKIMIDLRAITPLALNMDTDGLFIPFSDGLIIEQFTGLKDSKNVDIYEGDKTTMVENFDDEGVYAECGTIVWDAKRCCFLWDYQNKHNEFWTLDEACPFEVIGNIHEEKP